MHGTEQVFIEKSNYEILSAGADFTVFIGKRVYYNFDQLVAEESRGEFVKRTSQPDGSCFCLQMRNEEGGSVPYAVTVHESANSDYLELRLISLENMMQNQRALQTDITTKNRILGLYRDEFFVYDVKEDLVHIYTLGYAEHEICCMPLNVFFSTLERNYTEPNREPLSAFCQNIRKGELVFYLNAKGNLMGDRQSAEVTVIRGTAIYHNKDYSRAVGYIHYGVARGNSKRSGHHIDSLTGVMSKSEITNTAIDLIDHQHVANTCIAIVDVDHFKQVNDTLGHMAGDTMLRQVASMITEEVGSKGEVGRIGGDEFMIVFHGVADMECSRDLLRTIKYRILSAYPANGNGMPQISLSIGCASYPKDTDCFDTLFRLADCALYRAKKNGRNRYVIYDIAKHGSLEEFMRNNNTAMRMNGRGDMSTGDIVCALMTKISTEPGFTAQRLIEETCLNLELQRVILYRGGEKPMAFIAGENRPDKETVDNAISCMLDTSWKDMQGNSQVMVLNDAERLAVTAPEVYEKIEKLNVLSCIHIHGNDVNGVPYVLSIESVHTRVTWNTTLIPQYVLLGKAISEYDLSKEADGQ